MKVGVIGVGAIGSTIARRLAARGHEVDASDVDALAVEATRRNVPAARVHLADGIPPGAWDAIVTNPPLHRGAERDQAWVRSLVRRAPEHLRPKGMLVLVTRATLPVADWAESARAARLATDGRASVWSITSRGA